MIEEKIKTYFKSKDDGTYKKLSEKELQELNEYYMSCALAGLFDNPRAND